MANRSLIFTEHDCLWECHEHGACLCGGAPNNWTYRHWTTISKPEKQPYRRRIVKDEILPPSSTTQDHLQDSWQRAVEIFSHRRLSRQTDRLPAIAALASCIGRTRADQYLAGLWRSKLIEQLAWRPGLKPAISERSDKYVAPSWSWAACPFGVSFVRLDRYRRTVASQSGPWKHDGPQVLSAQCQTDRHSPYGMVSDGQITLRGVCRDVTLEFAIVADKANEVRLGSGSACIVLWSGTDSVSRIFDRHPVQSVPHVQPPGNHVVWYLRHKRSSASMAQTSSCWGEVRLLWLTDRVALILTHSTRVEGAYERLGLCILSDEAWERLPESIGCGLNNDGIKEVTLV